MVARESYKNGLKANGRVLIKLSDSLLPLILYYINYLIPLVFHDLFWTPIHRVSELNLALCIMADWRCRILPQRAQHHDLLGPDKRILPGYSSSFDSLSLIF